MPELTPPERDLLAVGLSRLPAGTQREISGRVSALRGQSAPFTCPFLDSQAGSCLVYDCRPIACRTYGFYMERYCTQIEEHVNSGEYAGVVWGNVAGVDAEVAGFGEKVGLLEWLGA